MTPFEVCETARRLLVGKVPGMRNPRVRAWLGDDAPISGALEGVSAVNAWIKVGGAKIPAGVVTRLEEM